MRAALIRLGGADDIASVAGNTKLALLPVSQVGIRATDLLTSRFGQLLGCNRFHRGFLLLNDDVELFAMLDCAI